MYGKTDFKKRFCLFVCLFYGVQNKQKYFELT